MRSEWLRFREALIAILPHGKECNVCTHNYYVVMWLYCAWQNARRDAGLI